MSSLFELDFTTKGKRVGIGLGLPTSFNIIKSHKGDLIVNSALGKGTTFKIQLPVK
jgi:two-component system C4-dicarboxylate transport sensor histidine kinase DctB